jgi:hypothetical protein
LRGREGCGWEEDGGEGPSPAAAVLHTPRTRAASGACPPHARPVGASPRFNWWVLYALCGCVQANRISLPNSSVVDMLEPIEGLELGRLLGKGAYGSVYAGTWMGTPVAVKVGD